MNFFQSRCHILEHFSISFEKITFCTEILTRKVELFHPQNNFSHQISVQKITIVHGCNRKQEIQLEFFYIIQKKSTMYILQLPSFLTFFAYIVAIFLLIIPFHNGLKRGYKYIFTTQRIKSTFFEKILVESFQRGCGVKKNFIKH